jgi:hypothetical protein
MECEISFFARYYSRRLATPKIPTWKIFTRKKSLEDIISISPYINYPAPDENAKINLLNLYFSEEFSLSSGSKLNKNRAKQIFMGVIACGHASILSTVNVTGARDWKHDVFVNVMNQVRVKEKFMRMFIMFLPRKNIDQDLIDFIVEQNILNNELKNLFWWIENLKIPKEKVFHTLENSRLHLEYNDEIMNLYKMIRKIKKFYKNKLLAKNNLVLN